MELYGQKSEEIDSETKSSRTEQNSYTKRYFETNGLVWFDHVELTETT
jgi:hypothetical protein